MYNRSTQPKSQNVDQFFTHFERIAQSLNWQKEHWTILLQSVLTGRAREIYNQLSVDQSLDSFHCPFVCCCVFWHCL